MGGTPPVQADYPAWVPVKVMGRAEQGFAQAIVDLVCAHFPAFDPASASLRPSRGGRYLSITCEVYAQERAELDVLYQALTAHPLVMIVL